MYYTESTIKMLIKIKAVVFDEMQLYDYLSEERANLFELYEFTDEVLHEMIGLKKW